jgi:MFS family permease
MPHHVGALTKMATDNSAPRADLPWRTTLAIYGTSFFSLSIVPMAALVVPLWALGLGASPLWIGIIVGARSLLPMLLSIHGGVLMDRLGTRRVMLFFAVITFVAFPLYPLLPSLYALVVLQLITGLTQGLSWVGSQTLYGQFTRGSPKHAGRVTFFTNAGSFVGPLIAGVVWSATGAVGSFALLTAWSFALLLTIVVLPRSVDKPIKKVTVRELVPRVSDYAKAFALCAIPVVALVMIFTFLRIAVAGVQSSFYVVYLENVGMTGTAIGILLGCANLVASPASLVTLPKRIVRPAWLMVHATIASIVFMTITPLFTDFHWLLVMAALYGAGVGIGFPTMISLLSNAVDPHVQGMSVGLRTTVNRVASLIVPVVMGAIAEIWDIETSFFIVGFVLMIIVAATAYFIWRHPEAYG